MPRTPVLNGKVLALRSSAAAGEAVSLGRPAVSWLNRLCFDRWFAVDQPYLTPRVVISGRNDSGRRNEGGSATQLVGSLGAMMCDLPSWIRDAVVDVRKGENSLRIPANTLRVANIKPLRFVALQFYITHYGISIMKSRWFIISLQMLYLLVPLYMLERIRSKVCLIMKICEESC
jgi:hypothetical protein